MNPNGRGRGGGGAPPSQRSARGRPVMVPVPLPQQPQEPARSTPAPAQEPEPEVISLDDDSDVEEESEVESSPLHSSSSEESEDEVENVKTERKSSGSDSSSRDSRWELSDSGDDEDRIKGDIVAYVVRELCKSKVLQVQETFDDVICEHEKSDSDTETNAANTKFLGLSMVNSTLSIIPEGCGSSEEDRSKRETSINSSSCAEVATLCTSRPEFGSAYSRDIHLKEGGIRPYAHVPRKMLASGKSTPTELLSELKNESSSSRSLSELNLGSNPADLQLFEHHAPGQQPEVNLEPTPSVGPLSELKYEPTPASLLDSTPDVLLSDLKAEPTSEELLLELNSEPTADEEELSEMNTELTSDSAELFESKAEATPEENLSELNSEPTADKLLSEIKMELTSAELLSDLKVEPISTGLLSKLNVEPPSTELLKLKSESTMSKPLSELKPTADALLSKLKSESTMSEPLSELKPTADELIPNFEISQAEMLSKVKSDATPTALLSELNTEPMVPAPSSEFESEPPEIELNNESEFSNDQTKYCCNVALASLDEIKLEIIVSDDQRECFSSSNEVSVADNDTEMIELPPLEFPSLSGLVIDNEVPCSSASLRSSAANRQLNEDNPNSSPGTNGEVSASRSDGELSSTLGQAARSSDSEAMLRFRERVLQQVKEKDFFRKTAVGRYMMIGLAMKTVDATKRPCVINGRIALIGSPALTGIVESSFARKYNMGDNIILKPQVTLKYTLQQYAKDGKDSVFKHFIYMMDCDDKFDMELLVKDLTLFKKYVKEYRVDVFYCRSSTNTQMNYPSMNVLARIQDSFPVFTQVLHYDVQISIDQAIQYARSRYVALATGTFKYLY